MYNAVGGRNILDAEVRMAVRRPEDAVEVLRSDHYFPEFREAFLALYLDARHAVITEKPYTVSIGCLSASLVHPREVFKEAVVLSAAAVILAHNHPSGTVKPSRDDLDLTARLDKVGDLLGIQVLDHIIVETENWHWISVREYGWPTTNNKEFAEVTT